MYFRISSSLWITLVTLSEFIQRGERRQKILSVRCSSSFGVTKEIRPDGGSQFTSKLSEVLFALLGYKHLVVVPYRPQANGLAERRMTEVMKHLRALVFEKRIKDNWSHYLRLAQRIINYLAD